MSSQGKKSFTLIQIRPKMDKTRRSVGLFHGVMRPFFIVVTVLIVFVVVTSRIFLHTSPVRHVQGANNDGVNYLKSLGRHLLSETESRTTVSPLWIVFDGREYKGTLGFLASFHSTFEWTVAVVGVGHSPARQSCPSCIFLDEDLMTKMSFEDIQPSVSGKFMTSRVDVHKMAAFLLAAETGGEWVFVTNRPFIPPFLDSLVKGELPTGLIYNQKDVFEPCAHFMDPYLWKRQLSHHEGRRFTINTVSQRAIYATVSHCYKKHVSQTLHEEGFDPRAPTPFVTAGHFTAVDFQNVLVPSEMFWVLMASFGKSKEHDTQALFNLFIQRITWEASSPIGFIPYSSKDISFPKVEKTCPTCELHASILKHFPDLPKRLLNWRCNRKLDFKECARKLITSFETWINDRGLSKLLALWFKELESAQYRFPFRDRFDLKKAETRKLGTPVLFSPSKRLIRLGMPEFVGAGNAMFLNTSKAVTRGDDGQMTRPRNVFRNICSKGNITVEGTSPRRHKIQNIVLVVVFNWATYVKDIPFLEMAYGRHFKHIVYCAEALGNFSRHYNDTTSSITYIEINHFRGHRGYECMAAALKVNYDVDGYLQISDDVLLNVWSLKNLPVDKLWFPKVKVGDVRAPRVPDIDKQDHWIPWDFDVGRSTAAIVLDGLKLLTAHPDVGSRVSPFLSQIYNVTKCNTCVLYQASDIFYIPNSLKFDFIFFSNIFSKHKLFLEITIPTIITGLTAKTPLHELDGDYVWYSNRDRYQTLYDPRKVFYHSFKLSRLATAKGLEFYCNVFLKELDRDLKKN